MCPEYLLRVLLGLAQEDPADQVPHGLPDVGLPEREDERVAEALEDDEAVGDGVDGEQHAGGQVLRGPAAPGGADQQVGGDRRQPPGHARQHDQKGHSRGPHVLATVLDWIITNVTVLYSSFASRYESVIVITRIAWFWHLRHNGQLQQQQQSDCC